jgi:hypothetical protein
LPNYIFFTPLNYFLLNDNFDLFNRFYTEITKYFREFINNEHLIDKIRSMFIYIFQNVSKFTEKRACDHYCSLCFNVNNFEMMTDNDDYDFDVDSEAKLEEFHKKIEVVVGYLKEIQQKVWENNEYFTLDFIKYNNK